MGEMTGCARGKVFQSREAFGEVREKKAVTNRSGPAQGPCPWQKVKKKTSKLKTKNEDSFPKEKKTSLQTGLPGHRGEEVFSC